MSKDTEKIFRQLNQYLDANGGDNMSDAEMERLVQQFMQEYNAKIDMRPESSEPETVEDWLELAEEATTKKKQLEYVNKALELEPDNLVARLSKINFTAKHPHEALDALAALLKKGEAQMEAGGYFRDNMGEFWAVLETRPFMRVCHNYLETLVHLGMMRKAMQMGERMLELCENDNLGERFQLMHLYAYLEDEAAALKLLARYNEHEESQLLLALAVLYYKLDRAEEAITYLKRLQKVNRDTRKFLRAASRGDFGDLDTRRYGYRPYSAEELIQEYEESFYLFESVPHFFKWAERCLKA